jgi:hypothetical protein
MEEYITIENDLGVKIKISKSALEDLTASGMKQEEIFEAILKGTKEGLKGDNNG